MSRKEVPVLSIVKYDIVDPDMVPQGSLLVQYDTGQGKARSTGRLLEERTFRFRFLHGCSGEVGFINIDDAYAHHVSTVLLCKTCGLRIEMPPVLTLADLCRWAKLSRWREAVVYDTPLTSDWRIYRDAIAHGTA
jgi:hypothetical protein